MELMPVFDRLYVKMIFQIIIHFFIDRFVKIHENAVEAYNGERQNNVDA